MKFYKASNEGSTERVYSGISKPIRQSLAGLITIGALSGAPTHIYAQDLDALTTGGKARPLEQFEQQYDGNFLTDGEVRNIRKKDKKLTRKQRVAKRKAAKEERAAALAEYDSRLKENQEALNGARALYTQTQKDIEILNDLEGRCGDCETEGDERRYEHGRNAALIRTKAQASDYQEGINSLNKEKGRLKEERRAVKKYGADGPKKAEGERDRRAAATARAAGAQAAEKATKDEAVRSRAKQKAAAAAALAEYDSRARAEAEAAKARRVTEAEMVAAAYQEQLGEKEAEINTTTNPDERRRLLIGYAALEEKARSANSALSKAHKSGIGSIREGHGGNAFTRDLGRAAEVYDEQYPADSRESLDKARQRAKAGLFGIPRALNGIAYGLSFGGMNVLEGDYPGKGLDHDRLASDDQGDPTFKEPIEGKGGLGQAITAPVHGAAEILGGVGQVGEGVIGAPLDAVNALTTRIPGVNYLFKAIARVVDPGTSTAPPTITAGIDALETIGVKIDESESRLMNRDRAFGSSEDLIGTVISLGAGALPITNNITNPSNAKDGDSWTIKLGDTIGDAIKFFLQPGGNGSGPVPGGGGVTGGTTGGAGGN
jgi:hypothetical protein